MKEVKPYNWLGICFEGMYEYTPNDFSTTDVREKFAHIATHALSVGEHYSEFLGRDIATVKEDGIYEKAAELFYWTGCGYEAFAQYNQAIDSYNKDLGISEKFLGVNNPDTAATYNNIAGVYDTLGDYDTALDLGHVLNL